jgi:hypothetical protein
MSREYGLDPRKDWRSLKMRAGLAAVIDQDTILVTLVCTRMGEYGGMYKTRSSTWKGKGHYHQAMNEQASYLRIPLQGTRVQSVLASFGFRRDNSRLRSDDQSKQRSSAPGWMGHGLLVGFFS